VILDVHGEVLLTGLERHALRHRPRGENAVALETKVVVEPPRIVSLDDKRRRLRLATLPAEGLGRLLAVPLALVLRELLAHEAFLLPRAFCVRPAPTTCASFRARFTGFKSYASRLHNEYMAGISLWTLWTVFGSEPRKTA
jgi:hypothetical protein